MASSSPQQPSVSVVVASLVGPPFIDECLASLEQQARACDAEVIVVACGGREYAERIERKFGWARVIHVETRETIPELRARGVEQARGEIVAIIEEHCLAAPDWLARAREAHRDGECGAAGGPVADAGYGRLRDWVVYFCEYHAYLPPWRDGPAPALATANVAYRRSVVLRYQDLLAATCWEASLHPKLLADGVCLRSVPSMIVRKRGPFEYGYYLRQRYLYSRAFAGWRARHLPGMQRLAYLASSPLLPLLLLARMTKGVCRKRSRIAKYAQSIPLLIPALVVYTAGEFVGYLAGPGDAGLRVE